MPRRSAAFLAVLLTFIPGTPTPAPHYLYSLLDGPTSTIWSSDGPRRIAQVSHLDGYGIRARPSPDGALLAYTRLPAPAPPVMLSEAKYLEGGQGELWVLRLSDGSQSLLLQDVDVRSAPVWAPDASRIGVRRGTALLSISLTGETTVLRPASAVQGVYPFAWRPEGLYYAVIDGGTDVYRNTEHIMRASDGIARDFRFDGDRLVYTDTVSGGMRLAGGKPPPYGDIPANAEFIGWLP